MITVFLFIDTLQLAAGRFISRSDSVWFIMLRSLYIRTFNGYANRARMTSVMRYPHDQKPVSG